MKFISVLSCSFGNSFINVALFFYFSSGMIKNIRILKNHFIFLKNALEKRKKRIILVLSVQTIEGITNDEQQKYGD